MRFLRFAVVLAVVSLLEAVDAALLSVTVGPGQQFTEPAYAISSLAPGFTMTVLAGTYYVPFDVPQNMGPFTIRGAGAGKTKFDGRGGIGGGHRLSWGKGFVHTRSPGTISGIEFTNCGGMDRVADGEAGVYAESFAKPGTLFINRCQFTRNENGIFVPSGASTTSTGYGISISVTKSDFFQNGQSKDGLSHDIYVSGASYSEAYCNHYGNPYGNNIKVGLKRQILRNTSHFLTSLFIFNSLSGPSTAPNNNRRLPPQQPLRTLARLSQRGHSNRHRRDLCHQRFRNRRQRDRIRRRESNEWCEAWRGCVYGIETVHWTDVVRECRGGGFGGVQEYHGLLDEVGGFDFRQLWGIDFGTCGKVAAGWDHICGGSGSAGLGERLMVISQMQYLANEIFM